jgi:type IV/VI secretion system ImpK/VasF family protein|tara:strand:+ start:1724 stop:2611 length:888 start_codon:yes stop_codon:yes gene_type:complete
MSAVQPEVTTITLTPQGVEDPTKGVVSLVTVSAGELQTLNLALREFNGSNNKLINATTDLLAVCGTITRLRPGDELNTTRDELSRAIIDLKYKVVRLDYPTSVAENLCLIFAIVIDEFVMASPWGNNSNWGNRTLVADLFGFRDGGYRFYMIADRALMQPRALGEFLEIVYFFLKLGFRGKYNRGSEQERDRLIDRLEAALPQLKMPESDKKQPNPGRPIFDSKTPARGWLLSRKLLLTVFLLGGMVIFSMFTMIQQTTRSDSVFEARRTAAAAAKSVDFVLSSQSGTTVERLRK